MAQRLKSCDTRYKVIGVSAPKECGVVAMSRPPITHPNGSLYCQIMEQLKWRVDAVIQTLQLVRNNEHYLGNLPAAEFCLLQLRFCCELLALGCIAIHTDIPQTKRLQKMWNADAIIKAFEELKPEFFPAAIKDEMQNGMITHVPVEGALTKSELLKMYNFFGGLLHAGTFKRYRNSEIRSYDFQMLEDFVSQLMKLLNNHTYKLYDQNKLIRVIMHNVDDGKVWLNELEKVR
jgi:hypothetical protein